MKISTGKFAMPKETGALMIQDKVSETQHQTALAERITNDLIRPFTINIAEDDLFDLKRRILATRWPEKETVSDQSQGAPLATLKALANYWATEYNWRKVEAKLNSHPNFITNVDGLDIHFIHVRSRHSNALPIIVTHGWPGSPIEQLKIIGPLSDPTAYGGSSEDAFDVVITSMPGYGFSGKPSTAGWGPSRIAYAWVTLMKRLGYAKFFVQGGDWGALVTDLMAIQSPENVLGIATNFPIGVPPEIKKGAFGGAPASSSLSLDEEQAYNQLSLFPTSFALQILMTKHPQTLIATSDSPIGLASVFLDHDERSLAMIAKVFNGESAGLTKDDVLDNITLTWLTNTALSGFRLYWENKYDFFQAQGVKVPVVISIFPEEFYQLPRSWARLAYPNMIYYKKHHKGGHFAAWEQPELLVKDIREGFKSIR